MPIFLITPLAGNAAQVGQAVQAHIAAGDVLALANSAGWLVQFKGTSVELSNQLGVTGQAPGERSPVGSTLITSVTSYYGRGPTDLWDWLKTRFEGAA